MDKRDALIAKLEEYIVFLDYFVFGLTKQQKTEQGILLTEIASIKSEIESEKQEKCPECGYYNGEHKHGCSEYFSDRDTNHAITGN